MFHAFIEIMKPSEPGHMTFFFALCGCTKLGVMAVMALRGTEMSTKDPKFPRCQGEEVEGAMLLFLGWDMGQDMGLFRRNFRS